MPELLRAEDLCYQFRDGSLGLDGACLSLDEGDFLLLAGRNGAGKTLLMRHLAGLMKPRSGRILYRGRETAPSEGVLRTKVGLVFQDPMAQIVCQSVLEDAAFGPLNQGYTPEEADERAMHALRVLGMDALAARDPASLSGGELRRLAIAGLLAMERECLILDEPFANLDYPSVRAVLETLAELHARGQTILLLTQEIEKSLAQATRLAIMDGGRIVYQGNPDGMDPADFPRHGLHNPFRRPQCRAELSWLLP